MSEQILSVLKRKLDDIVAYGEIDAETRRNTLKEELQFYVLDFIYHQPKYSKWIMYGGSALRIIHGLDRMSVDLDFEISHTITKEFLEELKKETEDYFTNTHGAKDNFLAIKINTDRGLLLKFNVGEELSFGHPSQQVHVKVDLNYFVAPKTVTERRPINHNQLSFVIITYNMSALMASKIAAIFLRGTRGIGKAIYEEKGRDIYDLLWYMNKKVVPDFDYLIAKGIAVKDPRALFDKLTLQINKASNTNLKQDLLPLFTNSTYIKNWLTNWMESYFKLLDGYKIRVVTSLQQVITREDFRAGIFSFTYLYNTEEEATIRITYSVTGEWVQAGEYLRVPINEDVIKKTTLELGELSNQLKQFLTLFFQKTENYFKKTNKIMLGDSIITKLIRTTTDNLNQKEQIVLNKPALMACELDDLLK